MLSLIKRTAAVAGVSAALVVGGAGVASATTGDDYGHGHRHHHGLLGGIYLPIDIDLDLNILSFGPYWR